MVKEVAESKTLHGPPLAEATGIGALTLGAFLLEVAERYGDRELLIFYEADSATRISWTYNELLNQSMTLAAAMIAGGITKGTRVGLVMGSRPECVATIFAAALAGAVVVPLSTMASADEMAYLIRHADIHTLFTQQSLGGKHQPLKMLCDLCPPLREAKTGDFYSEQFPYLRQLVALGFEGGEGAVVGWQEYIAKGSTVPPAIVRARCDEVSPADMGLIIYSSGTTANPKGVLHTQRAPTLQAWHQAKIFCRTPDTRIWTTFPLFWTAGFNTVMGATMAAGGSWVMQELFEAGAAIKLVEKEKVTEPYALPHHTGAMEEHADWLQADFSAVRCVSGRSPFTRHASTTEQNKNWHGVWAYGASETCAISITHYANTALDIISASAGRLLPGNSLRVVDTNSGDLLGVGEEGELCLKGPTLMERYVKASRESCFDADGFFHTGDSGFYDKDGYVHWTGRLTDMIKTAGANVSPAEVQRVIQRVLPTFKISQVMGMPDERLGQIVVLCVVLQEGDSQTEEDIRQALKAHLASYKVPRRVLFFEEEDIPMTASGEKVKDAELRELAARRIASTN
jgi:fatty-acyl-CoA synthase